MAPMLYALQQAREDLETWTAPLTDADLWATPVPTIAPIGFQIRHIAGSIDRLLTYLKNQPLTNDQLEQLKREREPGAGREQLLAELDKSLELARTVVSAIDPQAWPDPRTVGRKQLPTTVGGLITHIAEHTQRHVGEAIISVKLVTALR